MRCPLEYPYAGPFKILKKKKSKVFYHSAPPRILEQIEAQPEQLPAESKTEQGPPTVTLPRKMNLLRMTLQTRTR